MQSLQKIQFACVAQDLFKVNKIRQQTNDEYTVIILYDSIAVWNDQFRPLWIAAIRTPAGRSIFFRGLSTIFMR